VNYRRFILCQGAQVFPFAGLVGAGEKAEGEDCDFKAAGCDCSVAGARDLVDFERPPWMFLVTKLQPLVAQFPVSTDALAVSVELPLIRVPLAAEPVHVCSSRLRDPVP
jgi:hypothetical protein